MKKYQVRFVFGHYEAYSTNGKFICSGDTLAECCENAETELREESAA